MDRIRTPLSPPTFLAEYEVGYRSLGLVLDLFTEADIALRTQLLNDQVGLTPRQHPNLSEKVGQVFTSAITGFLTQVSPEQLPSPSMLLHSLTLLDNPIVQDGLDFSDPRHDELMHVAASIARTTFQWLHTQRESRLVNFTPQKGLELGDMDQQPIWWSGTPDVPRLWHDLLHMDRLTQTALKQPQLVSAEKRLRATHFCAAASQLLVEPTRPAAR